MEEILIVDFKALWRVMWKEKWWICFIIFLSVAISIIYALTASEEFEAQGKILPEVQSSPGGLGRFAGLMGLGTGTDPGIDAIRPDLYPSVINSTSFYLELLKAKVHTREGKEILFEQFYHNEIEKGIKPDEESLKKYPVKEEGIIVLNLLNERRLVDLKSRITSEIDAKNGMITIKVTTPDPVVSAEIARYVMDYLMEYIRNYRTEKQKKDVEYLAEQLETSKGKYYSTQEKRAGYLDQFQGMRLQSADLQRDRINNEFRISEAFYTELLRKYEEAKLKLQQETPVFKVLEPPVVPNLRAWPKRKIIVLAAVLLGSVFSLVFVLLKGNNFREVIVNRNFKR